jgi:hypothetical protein
MIRLHTVHAVSALSPRHGVIGLLRNSVGGGGGVELIGYILSYEQIILNLLSSVKYTRTYNSMSKGQILQYLTHT